MNIDKQNARTKFGISDSEVFDYLSLIYGTKPTLKNSMSVKLYSESDS